jgi:phage recombination protein Bet
MANQLATNNVVALDQVNARLPMTQGARARGITPAQWRVLVETTFPSAKSAESVELAIDYCAARGLDIFKKPIHIVPMYSAAKREYVETIWAGINEIQITASRTGQWAGMDSPKWGPMITQTFTGQKKDRGNWVNVSVEVTYPEWCEVTVHRLVGGQPRAFCEPVYWIEAYSTSGGKDSSLPTDMWIKRPRGQLHKVAKAASLRAAFPEEGELTAEEMEGKVIEAGGVVIDHQPMKPTDDTTDQPAGPSAEEIEKFEADVKEKLEGIRDQKALDDLWRSGINAKAREIGATDKPAMNRIITAFSAKKNAILKAEEDAAQEATGDAPDASEPEQAIHAAEAEEAPLSPAQEATLRKVKQDLGVEPGDTKKPVPPPATIAVPSEDGKPAWNRWAHEALAQLKTAGTDDYGIEWARKWLAMNAENIVRLREHNEDWAGRVEKLHAKVVDHFTPPQAEDAEAEAKAKGEADKHFKTIAVECGDDENPDWNGFAEKVRGYIRATPNHLVAASWWNRHAPIINNMRAADPAAAAALEADFSESFPQVTAK